ncbi:MAG: hypothetical protein HRT46_12285, partial [Deltaproteobacteria bacterium]|nr:hypothetical protein [Deltaproteobacteria bacterium]
MRYCRAMRWSCAAGALSLAVAVSATMAGVLAPRTSGEGLFDQALRRPLSSDRRSVQRSAVALLHPRQLDALQAGDALQLNLFDDTTRTFVLDRRLQSSPNRYQMIGHLQNEPDSTVIMVRRDQAVAGLIRSETAGTFLIRPAVGHGSLIQQIDETLMPPCGIGPEHAVHGEGALANAGAEAFCGSVRIDLLVVYSPEARQAAGGTAAMEAMIDLSIADTNLSYLRSEVGQRIYQVHAAELSQPESGSFFTDLGRLRTVGDGFYDEAHTLRDLYGADMVAMLIADTSLGGLAYIQLNPGAGFADSAFSVTNWLWAPLSVLAHELGHNMGCAHDRQNSSGGAFPHSYGYRYVGDSGEQWRTVMAYNPGSRIQNFSNPNVNVDGQPTGVPIGDPLEAANHDTLNQTAAIIAAYRPSVIDTGDPGAQGTEIVAPDQDVNDRFGFTVALDGDIALVGAPGDSEAGLNAGAAYVYRFDGEIWNFEAKLIGSEVADNDLFGWSVAIEDNTLIIGALLDEDPRNGVPNSGAAYIYRSGDAWVEQALLTAEAPSRFDQFGISVDLSNSVAVVGSNLDDNKNGGSAGSAYVYRYDGADWPLEQ